MAKAFDAGDLALPVDSEVRTLLAAYPDIEAVRFEDEEVLIRGGAEETEIWLLLRGACLIEQPGAPAERRPGGEMAIVEASPDAPVFVGEMAYLGRGRRTATVRASMAVYTLRLQPSHLDAIMQHYPELTGVLCRQFARRLRETNEQLRRMQALMAIAPEQDFLGAGTVLCEQGAPAERLYQLVDGTLLRQGRGETEIRPQPGQPCFVEARAYFRGTAWSATVRTAGPAMVLVYNADQKAALTRHFPELVLGLLKES